MNGEFRELSQCYRLLGLTPTASPPDIKTRYRELAKRWHPDRFAGRGPELDEAEERMKALNVAYRRIKAAPLRASSPRRDPSSSSTTAPRHVWRRETFWTRPCPKCGISLQVEGNRYATCGSCGIGFFPRNEGNLDRWEAYTNDAPLEQTLAIAALLITTIVIHFVEMSLPVAVLLLVAVWAYQTLDAWKSR